MIDLKFASSGESLLYSPSRLGNNQRHGQLHRNHRTSRGRERRGFPTFRCCYERTSILPANSGRRRRGLFDCPLADTQFRNTDMVLKVANAAGLGAAAEGGLKFNIIVPCFDECESTNLALVEAPPSPA